MSIQFSEDTITRFWNKVTIPLGEDSCWMWNASTRSKGYGAFAYTLNGVLVQDRAHRFSYMIHVGDIPEGLFVLHTCDNPPCTNPKHLFLGTNLDNVKDMVSKGRHVPGGTYSREGYPRGESHPGTRLTENEVLDIRAEYATGTTSYSKLAAKYNTHVSTICGIIKRRNWKHI